MGYTGLMGDKDPARGRRYKAARIAYGKRLGRHVTQKQVAEALGLKKGTVSRWEAGTHPPDDPEAVAKFYGCSPAYLQYGHGQLEFIDPPYSAWDEFVATEHPEPWLISSLRTFSTFEGPEPDLGLYRLLAFALTQHRNKAN
jgi:transcriptional regulator with XRE-family HTH domain